jgi:type I restriction enzyme S subunit
MIAPTVRLGDVADFTMGQAPPGASVSAIAKGVPFYRSGEFGARRPFLSAWTTNPLRTSRHGDVWVCVVGANAGDINLGVEGAIGRSVAAITAREHLDYLYLYYYLRFRESWLRRRAAGSAQAVLSKGDLSEIEVLLPAIETQRAIALALGTLDEKIETNRRIERLCSEIIDSESALFEAESARIPLGDLAQISRGSVNPLKLGDEVVHHYSLPAFDSGALPEHTVASAILSSKLSLTKPSVLVSRLNPRFDRTWWAVPDDETLSIASTEYAVLQADSLEQLAGVYLGVRSKAFREEVLSRVSGTSGSHQRVRPADLLTIEVPDTRTMDSDSRTKVLGLLERGRAATVESAALRSIRDALLLGIFSGQVRVGE